MTQTTTRDDGLLRALIEELRPYASKPLGSIKIDTDDIRKIVDWFDASAPAPAGGVDAVVQTAEKVRMSRRRHGGTYESSPFEFYPVQEVDALLHAIDLGGKIECEECSGTGHTGIDGDEVYDCPACNGEGSLSPAATPVSEAGGEAIQQWRWRCRNGEPAAWCDWKDGNPVVPFSEWNAEIYEWEKRTVYLAKPSSPADGDVREALEAAFDFLGGVDGASEVRDKLLAALSQSTAGRGE